MEETSKPQVLEPSEIHNRSDAAEYVLTAVNVRESMVASYYIHKSCLASKLAVLKQLLLVDMIQTSEIFEERRTVVNEVEYAVARMNKTVYVRVSEHVWNKLSAL